MEDNEDLPALALGISCEVDGVIIAGVRLGPKGATFEKVERARVPLPASGSNFGANLGQLVTERADEMRKCRPSKVVLVVSAHATPATAKIEAVVEMAAAAAGVPLTTIQRSSSTKFLGKHSGKYAPLLGEFNKYQLPAVGGLLRDTYGS